MQKLRYNNVGRLRTVFVRLLKAQRRLKIADVAAALAPCGFKRVTVESGSAS